MASSMGEGLSVSLRFDIWNSCAITVKSSLSAWIKKVNPHFVIASRRIFGQQVQQLLNPFLMGAPGDQPALVEGKAAALQGPLHLKGL